MILSRQSCQPCTYNTIPQSSEYASKYSKFIIHVQAICDCLANTSLSRYSCANCRRKTRAKQVANYVRQNVTFVMCENYLKRKSVCYRKKSPIIVSHYTPNGYIVPAAFGVHFLPRMKNIPKQTKLHLNEIGLTNIEFCKRRI